MQKNPVDDVLNKIIAELLKKNDFEGVSRIALNSLTDLVKEFIQSIGRDACEEAQMIMRPNVTLKEIISAVVGCYSVVADCLGVCKSSFAALSVQ
ncbi:hypothetical protein JH06_4569 [Blastocystis sp. subtype 4]|uniref:hypothetical protein n=1 Tax=Blastocystis sp. subtype 4 TaxID=944170 RepID=UPI000712195B|nr:hypothetical protein JH06_4569 [Blastocystis sp. subtype 4]KNB42339.1 hypothetical protein JH06_4569 [Blastocystis sp. subtype 4]|eukprot:XP_014525782.1 hypothetical protein JH06_4569 [Blastocystis sp. subtype 4]